MAFSFGNASAAGGAGGLTQGSDLEVIQTEGIGFISLAGDAKVQLTTRWSPAPSPTAHLISIASRKGLVAAAGPDAVHVATTDSVRKAFDAPKNGDSEARPFDPQAKLPLPFRISQLTFTSDEQYLILSAETGGGLAVYDVQALTNGATQSAFELGTNNQPLRALAPNPNPEFASLCAIVTTDGNLSMANLGEKALVSGANGPVLRSQVSCAVWSNKGKQLVAGMADGSLYQITPDGTEKAHIPKPPGLGDYHVSCITWLENNLFLVVHNPTNGQDPSVYHLITRQQASGAPPTYTYQKLRDPVEPFTAEKVPYHTILRLKDFPPNLQDLLMVSSTATDSIGLVTRSKTPLTGDMPAEAITNVFTTTELADDSKRAQLPMSEDLTETYPIGSAVDLSAKDKVYKPIPTDEEIEQSPGPLPALWVLNNEGVLACWWVVYNDSVRGGTTYPEIGAGEPATTAPPLTSAPPPALQPSTSGAATAFGQLGLGKPAFGQSPFGSKPAAAAAAPAFGAPSFGTPSVAPAFGQSTTIGLGAKVSPWAAASPAAAAPAFGQSGFASAGATPGKVFGSAAAPSPGGSGGFASFASKGGFGSVGGTSSGPSIFGKPSGGSPFASGSAPEVSMDSDTAFPPPSTKLGAKPETTGPAFGSSPFVLGSTWKADPKAAEDNESSNEKSTEGKEKSLFGSGFGTSLNDAAKQPAADSKDEDMDAPTPALEEKPRSVFGNVLPGQDKPKSVFGSDSAAQEKPKSIFGSAPEPQEKLGSIFSSAPAAAQEKPRSVFSESTTPTSTPAPQKFDFKSTAGTSGTSTTSLFGSSAFSSGAGIFGKSSLSGQSSIFGTPKIKKEDEDKENMANIPEAPLPPDTTSKAVFPLGDSSSSSGSSYSRYTAPKASFKVPDTPPAASSPPETTTPKPPAGGAEEKPVADDAPLPPDFLPQPPKEPTTDLPPAPISPEEDNFSDEDEEEGDDVTEELASEGSGVDVTKDLSPEAGFTGHTPGITPQSSFGGMAGSAFSTISRSEVEGRPLFGEIKNAPPLFPKPVPQSPRSPSPVRSAVRPSIFRDSARSVSAPGLASQFLGRKSQQTQQGSPFAASRQPPPVDPNVEAQRKRAAKKEEEETVFVDPEDEGIQQILHSELEPTLHINEFLAVDQKLEIDVTPGREDVPVACEALWRDINRMIDRLGLNSRSLQSFILGHSQYKETGRHKGDLEHPDDWVLVEAEDLGMLIDNELARDLEDGRVKDVEETEAALQAISRDLSKLRAKEEDIRRVIMTQTDPDQAAAARSMPLSAEQSTQQNELRRAYNTFVKLLAETEEALTMLKTKLASAGGPSGKTQVPTFEALIRTINKMTGMAEKRSGDVDVLENQMRRLRFSSVGPNGGSPAPRSREGSPFVGGMSTPQQKRASMIMSPGSGLRESSLGSSIAGSPYGGGRGGTPRKKMSMFNEEEKRAVRDRMKKRKDMFELLKTSLEKNGPNVERLRDDD